MMNTNKPTSSAPHIRPPIQNLADLVNGCSENPADRTVAVTAFVMTCCQIAGNRLSQRMPSLILVNPHGKEDNPVDDFTHLLIDKHHYLPPQVYKDGVFAQREPEDAPQVMEAATLKRNTLNPLDRLIEERCQQLEALFFHAQRSGFGSGLCWPYTTAWHDHFGLLSDWGGRVILRLDTREHGLAFRKDVVGKSGKFPTPPGKTAVVRGKRFRMR